MPFGMHPVCRRSTVLRITSHNIFSLITEYSSVSTVSVIPKHDLEQNRISTKELIRTQNWKIKVISGQSHSKNTCIQYLVVSSLL